MFGYIDPACQCLIITNLVTFCINQFLIPTVGLSWHFMLLIAGKIYFLDDNIWCHSSQRILLQELFQHFGSFGGQCISPLNGHGVSGARKHISFCSCNIQVQLLLNKRQVHFFNVFLGLGLHPYLLYNKNDYFVLNCFSHLDPVPSLW